MPGSGLDISDDLVIFLTPTVCILIPFAGIGFLFLVGHLQSKRPIRKSEHPLVSRLWQGAVVALVAGTVVLSVLRVPQRVGLAVSRPRFVELLGTAPEELFGSDLHRRIGLYHVDRPAADSKGGVYFRTTARPDGLGPDTMSFGFAFRPDPERTPFGSSSYSLWHLFGDWYAFAVSDD